MRIFKSKRNKKDNLKDLDKLVGGMLLCKSCGQNSIIQVAVSDNTSFYSCITEGCIKEAKLLVALCSGEFVEYDRVYRALKETVLNGITNETEDNEG
jgi:transcription elongation factor Elf1